MTRLEANLKILELIKEYLEKNPDQRFGQALVNLQILEEILVDSLKVIRDPWFEESEETLKKLTIEETSNELL